MKKLNKGGDEKSQDQEYPYRRTSEIAIHETLVALRAAGKPLREAAKAAGCSVEMAKEMLSFAPPTKRTWQRASG
jgi:hypothetical protein